MTFIGPSKDSAAWRLAKYAALLWVWLHAMIGNKYLDHRHPFRDKKFSFEELDKGEYAGRAFNYAFGGLYWLVVLALAARVLVSVI